MRSLPRLPERGAAPASAWLLDGSPFTAGVYRTSHADEVALDNGLVRRTFRLAPNGATVGLANLVTGQAVLRGVKPEATVTLDGARYDVGGDFHGEKSDLVRLRVLGFAACGALDEKALAAARARLEGLTAADVATLKDRHQAWWRRFWSRSFVETGDPLIERFWYGSHYLMASCSRAGEVPPGRFGNWITTAAPAWRGDFHLNYNHEAPFWGLYSSNHVETAASYETPILDFLPQAKADAHKHLDCRGVYYIVGIGPWGIRSGNLFLGQKSNASYAATNMVMRYYATYDLDYALEAAYPFLRQVGDFWEDYLRFEGGRYVIYNDAIQEGHTPKDVNPLLSLSASCAWSSARCST